MLMIHSFPPVVAERAHTLILGSMPGKRSLQQVEYYAHPRNAFWHIMGAVYGAGFNRVYPERLSMLQANGIALWDVIGHCSRNSSLDADIEESTIITNDFPWLFAHFPSIKRILFNGGKSEQSFRRYVVPQCHEQLQSIQCTRLPSTSPANARLRLEEKITIWQNTLLAD